MLRLLYYNSDGRSVASRLRRQRFEILRLMMSGLSGTIRILDIGGHPDYWKMMVPNLKGMDADLHITLLNTEMYSVSDLNDEARTTPGLTFVAVVGDARDLSPFADGEFDIAFSNSVIEHVGGFDDQRRMAAEVKRVGKRYYIQTPNRYFPVEPHFVFPIFQFLPLSWRAKLLQTFPLGWVPRIPDYNDALAAVSSVRLLSKAEFVALFPEGALYEESFLGMVKSFVVYTPIEQTAA